MAVLCRPGGWKSAGVSSGRLRGASSSTAPGPDGHHVRHTTTGGLTPATSSLKDGEDQDYGSNVFAGSYTVTEDDPSGDNFDLKPLDRVDCTYTNTLQTGAIKITKRRKHAADGPGDHPSRV